MVYVSGYSLNVCYKKTPHILWLTVIQKLVPPSGNRPGVSGSGWGTSAPLGDGNSSLLRVPSKKDTGESPGPAAHLPWARIQHITIPHCKGGWQMWSAAGEPSFVAEPPQVWKLLLLREIRGKMAFRDRPQCLLQCIQLTNTFLRVTISSFQMSQGKCKSAGNIKPNQTVFFFFPRLGVKMHFLQVIKYLKFLPCSICS